MRRRAWIALAAAVLLMCLHPSMSVAVERAEAEETARLLAKLLESGRAVIERNQSLIDDPHKGEKGFTPELFEQQLMREFHAKTGIDLNALPAAPVSGAFSVNCACTAWRWCAAWAASRSLPARTPPRSPTPDRAQAAMRRRH